MNSVLPPDSNRQEYFPLTDRAQLLRWFPWLMMFRAFRVAIHHRQMFVALIAFWTLTSGLECLDLLEGSQPQPREFEVIQSQFPFVSADLPVISSFTLPLTATLKLIAPRTASAEARTYLQFGIDLFRWVWVMLVLIGAGGVLSRIAALELTQYTECRILTSLRYVLQHFSTYCGGILITLFAMVFFYFLNVLFGLFGNIPGAGPYILWLVYPVAMIVGLLLTLMGLGLSIAWPLMVCTASVEGSDPFDGLSRSFNYAFARPWYGLFLLAIMCLYGGLLLYFVERIVWLTREVTSASVGCWFEMSALPTTRWLGFWDTLLASVPTAFAVSYFWTGATIIYLLLRKSEDATPLDAINRGDEGERSELPLVGIPAATYREQHARSPHR